MQGESLDSYNPNQSIKMKPIHTLITLGALAALPLGAVNAAQATSITPVDIKAEDEETKTLNLKITGMT